MKRLICFLLCSVFCLVFSGCSGEKQSQEDGVQLYFINDTETQIVSENYVPDASDINGLIAEFAEALVRGPENKEYKRALPETVSLLDYTFEEGGRLILNFDAAYSVYTGISEILCRAAIVKTFCQVDGVDGVEFYVEGQPLMLSGEIPLGVMREENFIYNVGSFTNYSNTEEITVFFTNAAGDKLKPYHREVNYEGSISKEQLIIKLLIQGPSVEDLGMYKTLPDETVLNNVHVKDKICYVDFSAAFLEKRPEVTEEVMIYSIVNSLVEQANITKVQFLVNGEQKKFFQNMDLSILYERNLTIVESEY